MSNVRRFSISLALALAAAAPLAAQQLTPEQYEGLRARHIGPVGNRVSSVAGVPGDRNTYFAGAATGGIWKTDDAGLHWRPVFDDQPVHSIGALAVAPSDHAVVWAGTGETSIRSNVSIGNGAWKSTDGGETWTHMGLEGTGRIGRILIHPHDADIVYVAALGHAYAESDERGVYRTSDGGVSWEKILFVDRGTGAYDMVMDPANPRKIFATMWDIDLKTWKRDSGGPGSGLHLTMDGGDTWTELAGNGLPTGTLGKIAVCMSHSDSDRVYALIETSDGVPMEGYEADTGELWSSDDGGRAWRLVNYSHDLATRQAYYTRCGVASDDRDELYFLSSSFSVSRDGGATYEMFNFLGGGPLGGDPQAPGWDLHDIWVDPGNSDRVFIGGDSGVAITENRMKSWSRMQLPIAQMYHVTVDNEIPYNVMGNRQDGPSYHGPSNTRYMGFWGARTHPARRLDDRGRRRERLRDARSHRPEHRVVERVRRRCGRRHRRAARPGTRPVPRRRSVARVHDGISGGGDPLPLPVDLPPPHLPARQRDDLRHEPARAPHAQPGPELGGHQSGPLHEQPGADDDLRRAHARQHRGGVLLRDLRLRRVAHRAGRVLGRHERRPRAGEPRRRRDVDERHGEHPEPASRRHRAEHRRLPLRRREGLHHDRAPPGGRLRRARLQDR